MKPTLKSLLVTSVLTLPSVFGSDSLTTSPQAPSADAVTRRPIEIQYVDSGNNIICINEKHRFTGALQILLLNQTWTKSTTPECRDDSVASIQQSSQFTSYEKLILTGLLPHARPLHMREAAQTLVILQNRRNTLTFSIDNFLLGSTPIQEAARILMQSVQPYNSRPSQLDDILWAAHVFDDLLKEEKFKSLAINLREQIARHPDAGIAEILGSVRALIGYQTPESIATAVDLCEQIQRRENVTAYDLERAADELLLISTAFGPEYSERIHGIFQKAIEAYSAYAARLERTSDERRLREELPPLKLKIESLQRKAAEVRQSSR